LNILYEITGDIVEILPKLLEIFQTYITNLIKVMSKKSQIHPFKSINILISLIIISQKKMFNIEKVGEKIAVISNSTRYKRKNKIYLNKEKLTGEDAIKESDLIHIEAGEIMLSPDKDVERTTMYVCGSAGSGKSYFVFLVSENDEDPAFDKKDYIKRIDITDIHENPIDWKALWLSMTLTPSRARMERPLMTCGTSF